MNTSIKPSTNLNFDLISKASEKDLLNQIKSKKQNLHTGYKQKMKSEDCVIFQKSTIKKNKSSKEISVEKKLKRSIPSYKHIKSKIYTGLNSKKSLKKI